jgi:hypothetical protein
MISQQQNSIHVNEEKAPASIENTTDAFQDPPPHKKSKAYKILFTLGCVCLGVGLLLLLLLNENSFEGEMAAGLVLFTIMFAFLCGVVLITIGVAVFPTDRKSR